MDDPSVYLSVCSRDSDFAPEFRCPVYKLKVPLPRVHRRRSSVTREESPHRTATLDIGAGGKTFVSFPPSGWIVGVGGDNPGGGTTTTPMTVVRGPDLVAGKWKPVVVAVGSRVYALCNRPDYKREPDFVPWFEVLDLSNAAVVEAADGGGLCLDGCCWEELPWPLCFPHRLTPRGYLCPPVISVRAYVAVGPYILVSLNQQTSCTYAFDTNSGEWHKIDKPLPFIGRATPIGHKSCVYLASSALDDEYVNAYRIRVSLSTKEYPDRGAALELSTTAACLTTNETHHQQVGTRMVGQRVVSLDRKRFSLLSFVLGDRKHRTCYFNEDGEWYPTKLYAKLTTYHIENPAHLEEARDHRGKRRAVNHDIAVSKQREQDFKFSGSYGFSSPPIPFFLSV